MSVLLKKIPKWFKKSNKRKVEYQKLFDNFKDLIPEGADGIKPPFKTYSETIWLNRCDTIERLVNN